MFRGWTSTALPHVPHMHLVHLVANSPARPSSLQSMYRSHSFESLSGGRLEGEIASSISSKLTPRDAQGNG